MNPILSKLVLALAVTALAGACSSPVKMDDKAPVTEAGALPISNTRAVQTTNANDADPLNNPKGVLANRSIYFDFDRYDVQEEFNSMLAAHANYLTRIRHARY